jgi:recombinational DNA repair protein RecR
MGHRRTKPGEQVPKNEKPGYIVLQQVIAKTRDCCTCRCFQASRYDCRICDRLQGPLKELITVHRLADPLQAIVSIMKSI